MPYIDTMIFEKVVSEHVDIDSVELESLIFAINREYSSLIKTNETADFKLVRSETLIGMCDQWDLFLHKSYRSALGKYYARKKVKEKKDGYTILEVDTTSVLVGFRRNVTLLFGVRSVGSPFNLQVKKRIPEKAWVYDEEIFSKAKRQAIAIIRSRQT
jgi:hypothetical protein